MLRRNKILVTCALHTTEVVAGELEELGFRPEKKDRLFVSLWGSLEDTYKMNLYLRTAHRVLFLLDKFRAKNADELSRHLSRYAWEDILTPKSYLSVSSTVRNETIRDNRFANVRVKDAIVDRIRSKTGKRPDSGSDRSGACIYLYWDKDYVEVYMDTSGESLAKHGYRKRPWKAPLQESLAAAIILSSQWDGKSPFINPMCGSGTLAIEAALICSTKPPGLIRKNYSFMHFKTFKPRVWEDLLTAARKGISNNSHPRIIASDKDERAIKVAKDNARDAGVMDMIEFHTCDYRDTPIPPGPGVIIINPEYGERLGGDKDLEQQYAEIGDFFKKNANLYVAYIFTGNLDLAKKVGLRTKRRLSFLNAKIEARLLEYEMFKGKLKS